jgi:hypothetical protein
VTGKGFLPGRSGNAGGRPGGDIIKMKDFGETLGTRGLGERVREKVLAELRSDENMRVVLDFGGVQVMTQSFGDELFRKLLVDVGPEQASRIGFSQVTDDVRAVLRYSLTTRGEPASSS